MAKYEREHAQSVALSGPTGQEIYSISTILRRSLSSLLLHRSTLRKLASFVEKIEPENVYVFQCQQNIFEFQTAC